MRKEWLIDKSHVKFPQNIKDVKKFLKKGADIENWPVFECLLLRPKQFDHPGINLEQAKEAEQLYSKYCDTDEYNHVKKTSKKTQEYNNKKTLKHQVDLNHLIQPCMKMVSAIGFVDAILSFTYIVISLIES